MVRVATFGLLLAGYADAAEMEHRVNPIRKVVTMLQMMQNKVTAEGKKAEEIFDKFMCYCDNADTLLAGAITTAENKIPQLEAAVGKDVEMKKQLETDVKNHKADREAAKGAIAEATALREKEATEFAKVSGDLKTNIAALAKAIPAIEKGMGSGFLQTTSASVVRQLSINMDMSNVDRQMLASFLSSKTGYAPASGEIVGILKTMEDEMNQNLADTTAAEESAIAAFEELKAAKTKEIDALTKSIEEKMTRIGEIAVKVAEMGNELEDTKEDLEESKKFLAELDVNCENKKKEWAAYQKMQGEELLALADTIKILNDDDALELFKKTLPGSASSFLQIQVTAQSAMRKALQTLKDNRRGSDPRVDLIEVALRGGKPGFEKIIKLIDELTAKLKEEQAEDDKKKEWCEAEIDKTEDTKKVLQNDISDLETAISDAEESITNLKAEIEALDDGIRALDKEVAEATETRKAEHDDFESTYAANTAAVDLLKFAKNRLNKFYNPKLYKPPPKRELSEDEQITLNMGGTLAPTAAPGGIAGTGISLVQVVAHTQHKEAPPPPPATWDAYSKKSEESGGVMAMMDMLVADLDKEMQEMEVEEKDAQSEYEQFTKDAAEKRLMDSKSITEKEGAKADAEALLEKETGERTDKMKEALATVNFIGSLHKDCDWLLQNFDVRKEARAGEVDSLKKAKAVLSGADFSLVQTKRFLSRA